MSSRLTKQDGSPLSQKSRWGNWNEERLLRFMIGQHTPDVDQNEEVVEILGNGDRAAASQKIWTEISPKKLVNLVRDVGAEVFYYYAKCHQGNAYYPSKVGHVHSAVRGSDFFGEVTAECIKHDIVPVGLYELYDIRIRMEKPDWCYKTEDGKTGWPCLSGPYGQFVLDQAAEIWERYPIASLFFDMLDFHWTGQWSCPYCEEIYLRDMGRKFAGISGMAAGELKAYYEWCKKQTADFMRRINATRAEIAPDCGFDHNFHGLYTPLVGHGWKDTRELSDGFHADVFAFRDGSVVDIWVPKVYRRAKPGYRSFILEDTSYSGTPRGADYSTPRPFDFYIGQAASLLANGIAFCSSILIEANGNMDATQAEVIKRTNAFFRPRKPWLLGAEPLPFAGLVFPGQSRELVVEGNAWPYNQEFLGWVRLLVENQIVFDVLVDELMTQELLERYRMLILPNAEALSEDQLKMIQAFVTEGGLLVATANTSLADLTGKRRGDLGLNTTLGVTLVQPLQIAPTYVHLTTAELVDPDDTISPWVFMPEGQTYVTMVEGAAEWARVGSTPKDSLSYLRHDTEFPAITSYHYGKGETWYLAGTPGLTYARYQYPAIPRLIKRMLKPYLDVHMPVQVDAPPCVQVEVALQKGPERVIVHLINHSGNPGWTVAVQDEGMLASRVFSTGQPHTVLPVTNVRIAVKEELIKGPLHAYVAPEKQTLPIVRTKEGVVITLGKVGLHEMVVLESQ